MRIALYSIAFIAALFGLLVLSGGLFILNETKTALVLQFGEVKREIREPGLKFKLPIIQNVIYYDKRVLSLDPPAFQVLLADKKRVTVDAYARYKISSPSLFYQRVRNDFRLRDRLGKSLNAALQRVLARASLTDVLTTKRRDIMAEIALETRKQAESLGVNIVDIRIGRTELPSQTQQAVFERMRAERAREARELRAEGNESAKKIRALADKSKTVLLAEARRKSEVLRGAGDAAKIRILGKTYSQNSKFFEFYKAMESYRNALVNGEETASFLISPEGDFFKFFKDIHGAKKVKK